MIEGQIENIGLVMQYYYHSNYCQAKTAFEPDCICWHDEGTGPLKDTPDCIRHWRIKPRTNLMQNQKLLGS